MATIVMITAQSLGLTPTVYLGKYVDNHGFTHKELVEAFRKNGLRPVTSASELMKAFLAGFCGYIPNEKFFEKTEPDCPYFEGEFYCADYLQRHGGWPPDGRWLLEKE